MSFLKTTFHEKNYSNSMKSGDLMEVLNQIGTRLSSIEKNIVWIMSLISQNGRGQGEDVPKGSFAPDNNVFNQGPRCTSTAEQVTTPHFNRKKEIKFENDSKKTGKEEDKKKQDLEKKGAGEPKKKGSEGIIQNSFGSFQEYGNSAKNERPEESKFKAPKKRSSEKENSQKGSNENKGGSQSPDPTGSDLILSDNNLKSLNENETVKSAEIGKRGSQAEEKQATGNEEKPDRQPKRRRRAHKNRNARQSNRGQGGRRQRKWRQYKNDDHYYF